jgi:hypothetical protein
LGVPVYHDPFETELGNAALKLAHRLVGVLEREGGHTDVAVWMRAHLFGEKIVHCASSVLRFDRVEDALHAERAEPRPEGEQHLVDARVVHGLKAGLVKVQ